MSAPVSERINQAHARGLLMLRGHDVAQFLQGIVTQDLRRLSAESPLLFSALLSPQGKILHEFFIHRPPAPHDDAVLLDTRAQDLADLQARLLRYRLRTPVEIRDVSAQWRVEVGGADGLADPRHAQLPLRHYQPLTDAPDSPDDADPAIAACQALGIPQLGHDFAADSVNLHDAGYDLLHAVSYSKGCYVGQEVTARLHYKQVARKGFLLALDAQGARRLLLLRFADLRMLPETGTPPLPAMAESFAPRRYTDATGTPHTLYLPQWLAPRYAQFLDRSREDATLSE